MVRVDGEDRMWGTGAIENSVEGRGGRSHYILRISQPLPQEL